MRLRCVSNYIRRRGCKPPLLNSKAVSGAIPVCFFNKIKCHEDVMNCGGRGAGTTLEGVGPALCPRIDPSLFIGGAVRPSCVWLGFFFKENI